MNERITPTEDEFRRPVEGFAVQMMAWFSYHPPNCKTRSGRWSSGSITGWPDTTFLREPRAVYVEFKGLKSPTTVPQIDTLNRLRGCDGHEVFMWRWGQVTTEEACNYLVARTRPPCPWTDPLIIGPWSVELLLDAGYIVKDAHGNVIKRRKPPSPEGAKRRIPPPRGR